MKKAKIMLMTIAVIATVCTALAFKVNKMGDFNYCYAETTIQPEKCENKIIYNAFALPGSGFFYIDVTGIANPNCTDLSCPNAAGSFGG